MISEPGSIIVCKSIRALYKTASSTRVDGFARENAVFLVLCSDGMMTNVLFNGRTYWVHEFRTDERL